MMCLLTQLHTNRLEVPFYVKSRYEFDRQYPDRTPARTKMEHEVREGEARGRSGKRSRVFLLPVLWEEL